MAAKKHCTIPRDALVNVRALLAEARLSEFHAYAYHNTGRRIPVIDVDEAREDVIALDAAIADVDVALGVKPRRPLSVR